MPLFPVLGLLALAAAAIPAAQEGDRDERRHGFDELELTPWIEEGPRAWLAERGVTVEVFLTADGSAVVHGGARTGDQALRHLLDVVLGVDLARAGLGLPGRVNATYQNIGGENGQPYVGALQGYSNIDAGTRSQLALLWYETDLGGGARTRLGKMDANSLFAAVDSAVRFLHPSAGFSPTVVGLPTYPDPAFGATLFAESSAGWSLGLGLWDGAGAEGVPTGSRGPSTFLGSPSAAFAVAELGRTWESRPGVPGRLALGAWHHDGEFERFDGTSEDGTSGLYLVLEQALAPGDTPGAVRTFLQLGTADEELHPFALHLGLGATVALPFGDCPLEEAGLYLSRVELSDEPGAGFSAGHETGVELYGFLVLTPWMHVVPDVQYVRNPGGGELEDAWVGTVRVSLSL